MLPKLVRLAAVCALSLLPSAVAFSADEPDPTGRPKKFGVGKGTFIAVWVEDGVWNIRSTSNFNRTKFSGTVKVKGDKVTTGEFLELEKDEDGVVRRDDFTGFSFTFSTGYKDSDGMTFRVGAKAESITFRILVEGDDDPAKILIGAKGLKPEKATFTFTLDETMKGPPKKK